MGRIKRILNNLSIKKTFMLYMFIFLLVATFFSSVAINISDRMRTNINLSYADSSSKIVFGDGTVILGSRQADTVFSAKDYVMINVCDFVQMWSIPIFFGLCIMLSSLLFYRNKLKKPIDVLNGASEKIANNDLNFHVFYDSKDEMGQLCSSFEKMRTSLEENNHEMWRSMDERKRLNAAFSHDLRTPLTVLRGYSDFLKNYLPQGKVSEEKLNSTVSTMSAHIARMESYVRMMSEVQRLEDICISAGKVNVDSFLGQLKSTAEVLAQGQKLEIQFVNTITDKEINIDAEIVVRVFENLISNAVRYAESMVTIRCKSANGVLAIIISDDGKGFSDEDLKEATKPFYKSKANVSGLHFGLGLNICKILCEKHGGGILLENVENGGASVTAKFFCGTKNIGIS